MSDQWTAEDLEKELAAKPKSKSRGRPPQAASTPEPDPIGEPESTPFPSHLLPVPVETLVAAAADVLVVPASYVGLPCLTVMATAIGTTRVAYVKDQFVEPTTLWTGVVGSSGSRKSAGYKLSMRRLRQRQSQWHDEYTEELEAWEVGEDVANETGQQGERRSPPVERQLYTVDTTVDALTDLMATGQRGVGVFTDEMDSWLAGMSRYTSSSERAHWLTFYDGGYHVVNRRKDKQSKHIWAAACCIHGGVQPLILGRNLTTENIGAGLYGRFMFGAEAEPEPEFHHREIHPATEQEWDWTVDALLELQHGTDTSGRAAPLVCKFSSGALDAYGSWWLKWQRRRQATKNPGLHASRAKLVGQAVRLALVMHCADVAWRGIHGQSVRPDVIEEEWVIRAMELCEWVDRQAVKIYGDEAVNTGLLARIQQMGRPVSARDLVTAKVFPTTDEATAALNDLSQAQKGEWSKEGKKRVFSLFEF